MFKRITISLVVMLMLSATAYAGNVEKTMQSAAVATGVGTVVGTSEMETKTIYIIATSVSSGAIIEIQTSYDGTNYTTISTQTIVANGTTEVAIVGLYHKYIRANITTWTDGTYTVYLLGKI